MKTLVEKITSNIKKILVVILSSLMLVTAITLNAILMPDLLSFGEDILRAKEHEISAYLESNVQAIESMVKLIDSDDNLETNLRKLKDFASVENNFESLGIVDLDGYVHVTSGSTFSIENREYYQAIVDDGVKTVLSDPVVSRDNNTAIILILTEIVDDDGTVSGYLSSAISILTIKDILAQSNNFDFNTQIIWDNRCIMEVGSTYKYFKDLTIPLSVNPNCVLSLKIPYTFFIKKILITSLIIFVVFIILLFLGIYFTKRSISKSMKPLETLTNSLSKAPEDLNAIEIESDSLEINKLTESTNKMLFRIDELINQIEQTERAKNESEYRALIQQIKPHFLYNTLEMIQSFCLDFEDDRAEKSIALLAKFFRVSLNNDKLFIPLSKELEQIESYVKIQQLRYQNRFDFTIDNQIKSDPYFLHFTLQPVVENAIYHGIKKQQVYGYIKVVCFEENDKIKITITNSADSIDKAKINRLNDLFVNCDNHDLYPGYGLYNVRQRLKLYFKDEASININCDGNSVWVDITHPKIEDENNEYINNG